MKDELRTHFLNLYHMALSDTEIDVTELEMLWLIGEEHGVSKKEIESVILNPNTINYTSPRSILDKVEALFDLARIAWADGVLDENEERLMFVFAKKFGFEEENIPIIIQLLFDETQKKTPKEEFIKLISKNI